MDSIRLYQSVCESIDANAASYTGVSDAIWDRPEVNFHEDFAASSLIAMLEEHGFSVIKNLAGLPNAFRAAYGSGKPLPPPVVSPTMRTLGKVFMMETKLLVALYDARLAKTTTGLRYFMRVSSMGSK